MIYFYCKIEIEIKTTIFKIFNIQILCFHSPTWVIRKLSFQNMSESDSKEHIVSTSSAVVSPEIAIFIAVLITFLVIVIVCFCYCKNVWIWRKKASLDENSNQLRYEMSLYSTSLVNLYVILKLQYFGRTTIQTWRLQSQGERRNHYQDRRCWLRGISFRQYVEVLKVFLLCRVSQVDNLWK